MDKLISIIIPVFNEEKNVELIYDELYKVIKLNDLNYEIIFVNDGSKDATKKQVSELCKRDINVKCISFSRNFGHQMALTAGYNFSNGEAIICMDGDLQQPPELIPEMIKKWIEGYDIVLTVREATEDATFFKNFTSSIFYKIINKLTGINIVEGSADFRLLDRRVVNTFNELTERNRFIRGLIPWLGYKQITIPYKAKSRIYGQSKYSIKKMFKFAFDGIISFSAYPLQLATFLGFIVSGASFMYLIYVLIAKLILNETISGWTSLIISILFIGGIQLICMGIIGQYISRIYDETKNRPLYIVEDFINIDIKKDNI